MPRAAHAGSRNYRSDGCNCITQAFRTCIGRIHSFCSMCFSRTMNLCSWNAKVLVRNIKPNAVKCCMHSTCSESNSADAGLSQLECLNLSRNSLSSESFPPGPYLANLRCLSLCENRLKTIPEVRKQGLGLTDTTGISTMGCCCVVNCPLFMHMWHHNLRKNAGDLCGMLCGRVPTRAADCSSALLADMLKTSMLIDLCCMYAAFIPQVLASATKLEALDVSENPDFQLGAHQLEQLASLRQLFLTQRLVSFNEEGLVLETVYAETWFPHVEIFLNDYMADEEWWQQEWSTSE